jgi:hypothetical protein
LLKNIIERINEGKYEIKYWINYTEFVNLVASVYYSVIDEEDNTYNPEAKDLALYTVLIKYFTDINCDELSADEVAEVIYNTYVIRAIKEYIDKGLYSAIISTIDSKIDFAVSKMKSSVTDEVLIKAANLFDVLAEGIHSITGKISNIDTSKFNVESLASLIPTSKPTKSKKHKSEVK